MVMAAIDPVTQLALPPGFRFYPTDEELLVQYLCRKVAGHQFSLQIIGEIDLYKFDPWVLPSKAIFGEKEWYFFSPRDRKYPNGSRPNRVAGSGYWKATGTDKIIMTEGRKVGIKKALVFYILLVQYLCRKVAGHQFSLQIIGEIDLYKFDPWVLPSKAIFGEKEWYFFSPRDRKYPNGSRPNRVAGSGYWKATGTDKIIMTEGRKVGIKKALVFYIGKAPKGTKTNWIMHEYRLLETSKKHGSSRLDDWVLCRIYKKNSSAQKTISSSNGIVSSTTNIKEQSISNGSSSSSSSHFDDVLDSLPEINDHFFALPRMNSLKNFQDEKFNFQNLDSGKFDWSSLASMSELVSSNNNQIQRSTNNNNNQTLSSIPPLYHIDSPPSEKFGSSIEEEVESRVAGAQQQQRFDNSVYLQNSNGFGQGFIDSDDPFGIRFLTQPVPGMGNFGYRQ